MSRIPRSSKCLLALAVANVAVMLSPGTRPAHAETWIGPAPGDGSLGGDFNNAAHWNPASAPNAVGAVAIFNGSPVLTNSTRTNPLSVATTLGSLQFNDNNTDASTATRATTVGADGGPLLTFDNGGAGATINLTGNVTSNSANPFAIRGSVHLAETLTINANLQRNTTNDGITLNFLGATQTVTGPGGLIKNGPYTVAFADNFKAFTGPTVINQGRVRFNGAAGDAGGFSATSSITVNSGGQLAFDTAATGTNNLGGTPNMVITLNGAGIPNFGGAIRVESNRVTSNNNLITLASDASITTVSAGSQLTLSNVISGPGMLGHNTSAGSGVGTLILSGANTYLGGTTNGAGTLRITPGGSVGSGNVTNNATFDVFATTTLGGVSGTGNTTIGDGANAVTVTANHFRQNTLTVKSTAVVAASGGAASGASKVNTYALDPTAKLDLKDNKLISNNPLGVEAAGIYSGVQGDVQRASNGGAWDQPGLTTSLPDAAGGLTSIGVATGEQILGLGPTDTATFAGQTITGASTVAMYTYAGDANMDGFISGDDYAAIDFNVAVPGSDGWYNGDFNYDGIISADDYSAIDYNLVAQGAPL